MNKRENFAHKANNSTDNRGNFKHLDGLSFILASNELPNLKHFCM